MTLISAISRSHGYVVACADLGSFHGMHAGAEFLGNTGELKSLAVTERVVALAGGCRAITNDFLGFMAHVAGPGDDIDDCYQHARDFVAWAEENDRPGEPYLNPNVPGGWAARSAMKSNDQDAPSFNFIMSGFRRDGRTRLVQYQGDTGFEDFDDRDQGEFACGTPLGVEGELAQTFFHIEAPPLLHEAFSHVFGFHRIVYRLHPDKVTREMCGILLRWRDGDSPERITLNCEVDDFDQLNSLYGWLGMTEGERLRSGGRP